MRILAILTLVASLASAFPVSAQAKAKGALNQNIKQDIKIQLNKLAKDNSRDKNAGIDIGVARSDGKMTWEDNLVVAVYVPGVFEKKKSAGGKKAVSADLPDGDFTINASAYTAAADECGKSDGITASGKKVTQGRTLACPKGYDFGTKIEIDGMGTYTCEDRGGAIKGNHFDIYMQTKSQAFAFGRRSLTARVVN